MTKDEVLKLALEALKQIDEAMPFPVAKLAQKAIREALAQPELTLDGLTPTEFALRELYEFQEATGCDTAAEFKAQPKQKPVPASDTSQERVDETAKREQEPVAWMWKDGSLTSDPDEADGTWTKLYTAPLKREWVGLTDDDYNELLDTGDWGGSLIQATEAKLKEKNT